MASKKRTRSLKKVHSPSLFNASIFEIPNLEEMKLVDSDSDIAESILESELEALLGNKTKSKSEMPSAHSKKVVAAPLEIEKIVAECMIDDITDENSDDESLLTDPELLKELDELTCEVEERGDGAEIIEKDKLCLAPTPKEAASLTSSQNPPESTLAILEERLELYKQALCAATGLGDNLKVRRFSRAKKTLEELIKSAKSNKTVNIESIPPIVCIPKEKPVVEKEPSQSNLNEDRLVTLTEPSTELPTTLEDPTL